MQTTFEAFFREAIEANPRRNIKDMMTGERREDSIYPFPLVR
jgi:hypothetical protein